jgi:hypothetical protein
MTGRDECGAATGWDGVLLIGLFSFDANLPSAIFGVKIIFL